ncbi:MAG: hypothetical protein ACYTDU_02695 [Planctomycetota bacterium]
MADRRERSSLRVLMGFGLDSDGHARVTEGEDYVLLGGSENTHGRMQDEVERFRDVLHKMGTDLQRASKDEVLEAAHESGLIR